MSRFPRRASARLAVLLSAGLLPLSALHAQAGAGSADLPPDPLDARIEEARNAYGAGDYDTSIAALETVLAEAAGQGKPVRDHTAHLIVHGILHLMGYDHMARGEARRMEKLERRVLGRFGIGDPYA